MIYANGRVVVIRSLDVSRNTAGEGGGGRFDWVGPTEMKWGSDPEESQSEQTQSLS